MAGAKTEEFDEEFEEGAATESDGDEAAKVVVAKNSPTRRRVIDELLEERKLQRRLRDFDYDLDDDK
ncbi:MAG: hypothetical protein REI12_04400 [Pedobacter sp.]|nr:hypothetical protein [Pedobacter sp.]